VIEVEEAASLKLLDVQTIEVDVPIICQTIEENRLIIETTKNSRTVQYGWENAPAVSLFNEVGYPVAPFKFEKQKGEE
jgi:sialate O-acetylesterase